MQIVHILICWSLLGNIKNQYVLIFLIPIIFFVYFDAILLEAWKFRNSFLIILAFYI